ncbi:hypothetical protein LVJ94_02725 [Pendulispora rubella]|uniref:Uncharacterized protein n=1 Tax=Pendulispora rubella TaxID=2741070 RepID=A0ABZ2LAD7_9BACT
MQCHIGLGVGAMHTARVLQRHGIKAHAYGIWTPDQIRPLLSKHPDTTHCIIEAPWVPLGDTQQLLADHPYVRFAVRSHSNMAFLQVEAGAIVLLRDLMVLEDNVLNLDVAANSAHLAHFFERTYSGRCVYLPNLYDLERPRRKRDVQHDHRLVRVGRFGALRLLKMHTAAASAAMLLARDRGCDLEFYISVDREEHGGGVIDALRAMFANLPWARLIESPWQDWGHFRRTVEHLDLHVQASGTETFNLTMADAVSAGVKVVGSPAIEWLPAHWQVEADRIEDMARVGGAALASNDAAGEQFRALETFGERTVQLWLEYFR